MPRGSARSLETLDDIRSRGQEIDRRVQAITDELDSLRRAESDLQARVTKALTELASRLGVKVVLESVDGGTPRRTRRRRGEGSLTDDMMSVLRAVDAGLESDGLEGVVAALHQGLGLYDWVGFYLMNGDQTELTLGPSRGRPTCHETIALDEGVCGAAASARETIIVPDVHADPRYLECSAETQSEIVIPVVAAGRCFGVLDIDSDQPDAFDDDQRRFLELIAQRCAARLAAAVA